MTAKTLYDKIWDAHVIRDNGDGTFLIYIDRQIIHEVTSPQAFEGLKITGRKPWRPKASLAVPDHNVPTTGRTNIVDPVSAKQLETLENNAHDTDVIYIDLMDERQGIVHVVGPEQGACLPGMTIVCGDSHTTTNGAVGALAFGIGTSDVEHVLATQTMVMQKAKNMLVKVTGDLGPGVTAKDMALHIIGHVGTAGGTGHALEFGGDAVKALSMEGRLTLCNLAIEAGARAGMVATDEKTIEYVEGRPFSPKGEQWDLAVANWQNLHSDEGAEFDLVVDINAADIKPSVTWGTSPEMVVAVDALVPDPASEADPIKQEGMNNALKYMGLEAGTPIQAINLDKVFIGSCTNSRIEDLRAAAAIAKGNKVSDSITLAMVVPGSGLVKKQAEAEGLHHIFTEAGFEWREPGCSMCLAMNEDRLSPQERCASTSNRNFEGRQGAGGRTHLVSPAMAAAAAIAGHFVDIRDL